MMMFVVVDFRLKFIFILCYTEECMRYQLIVIRLDYLFIAKTDGWDFLQIFFRV